MQDRSPEPMVCDCRSICENDLGLRSESHSQGFRDGSIDREQAAAAVRIGSRRSKPLFGPTNLGLFGPTASLGLQQSPRDGQCTIWTRLASENTGKQSNLQTLSPFYVGNDREHHVIRELGNLANLRGELRILGLKHVVCVDDAKAANSVSKAQLEKLTLEWFSSSIDYSKAD